MSKGDLNGRTALVTGSTTGIGRAIAESLASRGAAVMAHGLDPLQTDAVAADWSSQGWRCARSDADLGVSGAARRLVDGVTATLGPIDILVLNASIELPQRLEDLSEDAIELQLAVNVASSALLLQACLPSMKEREWGRVVAVGSVQEERPNARHLVYAATKVAVTSMVLNLARHEAVPGVTLNVVRPGAILTDRNRDVLAAEDFRRSVLDRIPLQRIGDPSDCSKIVSMLCSDMAAYVNGAVIAVDGGLRL